MIISLITQSIDITFQAIRYSTVSSNVHVFYPKDQKDIEILRNAGLIIHKLDTAPHAKLDLHGQGYSISIK